MLWDVNNVSLYVSVTGVCVCVWGGGGGSANNKR